MGDFWAPTKTLPMASPLGIAAIVLVVGAAFMLVWAARCNGALACWPKEGIAARASAPGQKYIVTSEHCGHCKQAKQLALQMAARVTFVDYAVSQTMAGFSGQSIQGVPAAFVADASGLMQPALDPLTNKKIVGNSPALHKFMEG